MTPENLKKLIDSKVKEHKYEIELCESEMTKQKKKANDSREKNKNPQNVLTETSKLAILKDKMLFHKAAISVLEELRGELE